MLFSQLLARCCFDEANNSTSPIVFVRDTKHAKTGAVVWEFELVFVLRKLQSQLFVANGIHASVVVSQWRTGRAQRLRALVSPEERNVSCKAVFWRRRTVVTELLRAAVRLSDATATSEDCHDAIPHEEAPRWQL